MRILEVKILLWGAIASLLVGVNAWAVTIGQGHSQSDALKEGVMQSIWGGLICGLIMYFLRKKKQN